MTTGPLPTEPSPAEPPMPAAPIARPPTLFDRIARWLALLGLIVAFTVIYWIPLGLVQSPFGAPFVLAILTILAVNLASRLHRLRQRVDELEARAPPQK